MMDIGMMVQEDVEMGTMEVAGAMVVVTSVAGVSLAAGVATEVDFLVVERDIRGVITWVAMVGA